MFMDLNGAVVADTVYVDNTLVAKDVSIVLPEVAPQSIDLTALGTMSLPNWLMLDNMETTVTKIGVDLGFRSMVKPESMDVEFRWVHTLTGADGNTTNQGCKAFIHGVPTKIPSISVAPGEAGENECAFMTTRYQLYVGGEEMFLIDRLAGIVRIGGTDYAAGLSNLL